MKNIIFILCCWLTIQQQVFGQLEGEKPTYTVGDTLPDLPLGRYLTNHPLKNASIRDFKGKYVILDFWETYCQPCINALPKLQALQNQYGDKLQIVAVTGDTEKNVKGLLDRSEITKNENIRLPFAVEDTLLRKVFPHLVIPHVIVISPEGIVQAITHGTEITESKIQALMVGEEVSFALKKETEEQEAAMKGDFLPTEGEEVPEFIWRSYLKKGGTGWSEVDRYPETGTVKYFHMELYPAQIYFKVFSYLYLHKSMGNMNRNRIAVDVKNPLTFLKYTNNKLPSPFFPKTFPYLNYQNISEYERDNLLVYHAEFESGIPDSTVLKFVFSDLNKSFPFNGKVVLQRKRCYILKADTAKVKKLQTTGGTKVVPFDGTKIIMKNAELWEFLKVLNTFKWAPPIFDETGIDFPVDFVLDLSASKNRNPKNGFIVNNDLDLEVLERELEKLGMYFETEYRDVEVLMLYD